MAKSYETYLKVNNNTNLRIVNTTIKEITPNGWDGGSKRGCNDFHGVSISPHSSSTKRQEVNSDGIASIFEMILKFETGHEIAFRADQNISMYGEHKQGVFGLYPILVDRPHLLKDVRSFNNLENYSGNGKFSVEHKNVKRNGTKGEGWGILEITIAGDRNAQIEGEKYIEEAAKFERIEEFNKAIENMNIGIAINPNDQGKYLTLRREIEKKQEVIEEAKVRAAKEKAEKDAEVKVKAAEEKAQKDAEVKVKAAEEKARKDAEVKVKAAEEKARKDAEVKVKAAEEKTRKDAEVKVKAAEEKARKDAEVKVKAAEEKAQKDAEVKVKAAEEKARKDAEVKVKAAEEKAQKDAEVKVKAAEEKARKDAEVKVKAAEEKARKDAEVKVKAAEGKAQKDAEVKVKAAEEKARKDAEVKIRAIEEDQKIKEGNKYAKEATGELESGNQFEALELLEKAKESYDQVSTKSEELGKYYVDLLSNFEKCGENISKYVKESESKFENFPSIIASLKEIYADKSILTPVSPTHDEVIYVQDVECNRVKFEINTSDAEMPTFKNSIEEIASQNLTGESPIFDNN